MSIIMGVLGKNCGVVASDGRLTGEATYESNVLTKTAPILSDNFDKTFEFNDHKIIGACAGIMHIDNNPIKVHIAEALSKFGTAASLQLKLDAIYNLLQARLEQMADSQALFRFRKLDLILIGTESGRSADLKLYPAQIKPNSSNTLIIVRKGDVLSQPKVAKRINWQLYGDEAARTAVKQHLDIVLANNEGVSEKQIRSLMYPAIKIGIINSGKSEFGDHQSCGGKSFVKSIA